MNNYTPRNFKSWVKQTFLETSNPPKLSQEEIESLNRPRSASKIEAMIKKLPVHKALGQMASQENFTKHLEKS